MPTRKQDLPGTLKRSPAKAQRTFAKTKDTAEARYGDASRAARTAWSAVKHSFEKRGDHWEAKDEKGPSDAQAAKSGAAAREGGKTAGGVDVAGSTKAELMERAKKLDVKGRSKMSKEELGRAIARKQD